MSVAVINLPLDRSGKSADNLIVGVKHTLESDVGSNYPLVTLTHGGFYQKGLKVYDRFYNELVLGDDFVLSYYHKDASEFLGLEVYSLLIIINPTIVDHIYVTAQMVGGDLAYSFTVVDDYIRHLVTESGSYVPSNKDYYGAEPIYGPGELEKLRWRLDTYQPFNNEINELTRAVIGMYGDEEETLRAYIRSKYGEFTDAFTNIIAAHLADKDNPHELTKRQINLTLLENFKVASTEIANAGTSNEHYLTPALTWNAFKVNGIDPLNAHIADDNNPHRVTPLQLRTLIKSQVDTLVDKKYFKNEVVSDSINGHYGDIKSYIRILADFRKNLPANKFTVGFINPARMALGNASSQTVITSNPYRWSDWRDILALNPPSLPGSIVEAFFAAGTSATAAHNFIATQNPYRSLPNNSIVFYKIRHMYYTFRTNGATEKPNKMYSYASYKDNNGVWRTSL